MEAIQGARAVAALEWRAALGLRGCGWGGGIAFPRGCWDKRGFPSMHGLAIEWRASGAAPAPILLP